MPRLPKFLDFVNQMNVLWSERNVEGKKSMENSKKDEPDSDDANNNKTACRLLSTFSSRETGSLDGRVTGELV